MKLITNFIFVIIISIFGSCYSNNNSFLVTKYFPEISQLPLKNLKVQKIDGDPSYLKPYNIYIRVEADDKTKKEIIKLFSQNQSLIDTSYFKIGRPPTEFRLYFTMESINAFRNANLNIHENWWNEDNLKTQRKVFVSPYLDNTKQVGLTSNVRIANGRAALYASEEYCYILIECWG